MEPVETKAQCRRIWIRVGRVLFYAVSRPNSPAAATTRPVIKVLCECEGTTGFGRELLVASAAPEGYITNFRTKQSVVVTMTITDYVQLPQNNVSFTTNSSLLKRRFYFYYNY